MRRRNLKFTASLRPSLMYLQATIGLHTFASLASLCLDIPLGQHLIVLAAFSCSLCYQLNIYQRQTRWTQVCLEGNRAMCRLGKKVYFPSYTLSANPNPRADYEEEYSAELLPKAWVLPRLIVLFMRLKDSNYMSLLIFNDSVTKDDFRKLRIFVLNGPLLQKTASKNNGNDV